MSATAALPSPYRLPTPGDNMRALVFAVLIHVAAALLMFVGVWTSVQEPMIDAGEPIDAVMVDLSAAPLPKVTPKPAPPKPAPPKPEIAKPAPEPPRVEVGKLDDVTDQKLTPPKVDVDELAVAQEEERKKHREEERRRQLEEIRKQRDQAEKDRQKAEADLKKVQAQQQKEDLVRQLEAEAKAKREAEVSAALRGTVATEDLLAQWRNAVRQAIEQQWNLPTGTPAKLECGVRITAVKGGTVVFRTVTQPCQLPVELQQTLLDAVDSADPLPYVGFESVFQTQIPIIFVTPESN